LAGSIRLILAARDNRGEGQNGERCEELGKAAALAGVSPDTIRYYEWLGLLQKPSRTAGGYRVYPPAIVLRLAVIGNAKRFGFPLRDIDETLRRTPPGQPARLLERHVNCGSFRAGNTGRPSARSNACAICSSPRSSR
jgi:DNA-binding transcriptional MerR regulator